MLFTFVGIAVALFHCSWFLFMEARKEVSSGVALCGMRVQAKIFLCVLLLLALLAAQHCFPLLRREAGGQRGITTQSVREGQERSKRKQNRRLCSASLASFLPPTSLCVALPLPQLFSVKRRQEWSYSSYVTSLEFSFLVIGFWLGHIKFCVCLICI